MTLAVAVKVQKSSPNNEVIGQIVVVVSLDLVEVNVAVMVDLNVRGFCAPCKVVVMSMAQVADRSCCEKRNLNVSTLARQGLRVNDQTNYLKLEQKPEVNITDILDFAGSKMLKTIIFCTKNSRLNKNSRVNLSESV